MTDARVLRNADGAFPIRAWSKFWTRIWPMRPSFKLCCTFPLACSRIIHSHANEQRTPTAKEALLRQSRARHENRSVPFLLKIRGTKGRPKHPHNGYGSGGAPRRAAPATPNRRRNRGSYPSPAFRPNHQPNRSNKPILDLCQGYTMPSAFAHTVRNTRPHSIPSCSGRSAYSGLAHLGRFGPWNTLQYAALHLDYA